MKRFFLNQFDDTYKPKLVLEPGEPNDPPEYLYASIDCMRVNCSHTMDLPFVELPRLDTNPPTWPPDGWHAKIGCSQCGSVRQYSKSDIFWHNLGSEGEGEYLSEVRCFRAEFPCGQGSCRIPMRFYVPELECSIFGRPPVTKDVGYIAKQIREGHYHGDCDSGHNFLPPPRDRVRLTLIQMSIPSD